MEKTGTELGYLGSLFHMYCTFLLIMAYQNIPYLANLSLTMLVWESHGIPSILGLFTMGMLDRTLQDRVTQWQVLAQSKQVDSFAINLFCNSAGQRRGPLHTLHGSKSGFAVKLAFDKELLINFAAMALFFVPAHTNEHLWKL